MAAKVKPPAPVITAPFERRRQQVMTWERHVDATDPGPNWNDAMTEVTARVTAPLPRPAVEVDITFDPDPDPEAECTVEITAPLGVQLG